MCLIAFANQTHPRYRLVLVANRDEFYDRECTSMHWWANDSILAGRDEVAKGTWLGVNRSGKWAAVTNFRGVHREIGISQPANPVSRGELVGNYLNNNSTALNYRDHLGKKLNQYSGFNLLVGDENSIFWISNRGKYTVKPLASGIHGLSNHLLNTAWPKVSLAKTRLENRLQQFGSALDLVDTLYDQSRPPDDQLPKTGVGLEKERLLSSMFIESNPLNYGTRCSTVLTISNDNEISVVERSYPSSATVEFDFTASSK